MRPIRRTVGSQTVSTVIPVDTYACPFIIGAAVDITNTCTYSVEMTFEDVQAAGFDPSTAKWFAAHTDLTTKSADGFAKLDTPCTGLRLNVTAYTSGTATLTVIQSGGGLG